MVVKIASSSVDSLCSAIVASESLSLVSISKSSQYCVSAAFLYVVDLIREIRARSNTTRGQHPGVDAKAAGVAVRSWQPYH